MSDVLRQLTRVGDAEIGEGTVGRNNYTLGHIICRRSSTTVDEKEIRPADCLIEFLWTPEGRLLAYKSWWCIMR